MKKTVSIALCAVVVLLLHAALAAGAEVRLGGGAPPIEKVIAPVKDSFQKQTGITINARTYGPKFALIDLAKGEIEAAVLFLKAEEVAALAKKENIAIDAATLQQFNVGGDTIKIILNRENPVSSLTKEQAKGLLTGKTSNWKGVGGKDLPVIVVYGTLIRGVNEIVAKSLLDNEAFAKDVLEVATAQDVRSAVASNPEAIGLSSVALVDTSIKVPDQPDISVPVIIYTKGAPSPNVQKLIDFLKK